VTGSVLAAGLVVAAAVSGRRAVLASRLGSRRPIRAGARRHPPSWAAALAADLGLEPATAWPAWLAAVVVALLAGLFAPALSVLLLAVVGAGPYAARRALARRRLRRATADIPVVLEAAARSLRAGAGLHAAVADGARAVTGPVAEELRGVTAKTDRGEPLADALGEWKQASKVSGVRLAVHALSVAADIGGPQAAAIDGVAATLRQRLAAQAEAWALGSQARLSALVIALAPLVFGVLASMADPQHAAFLLRTPLGLVLLVVGLALDLAGALWMARLTRIGGPP
jgi:tight adherence protein B